MATQTTFSMRMDAKLKERLQAMANNKGMNLSTMTLLMFQHFLKHPQLEVDFRDERDDVYFSESVSAEDFIIALDK